MFTSHRTILAALLALCSLKSIHAAFHNSGSMHATETALFCPEVVNTGTMVAEKVDASGLQTFTNSGDLSFKSATINNGARFNFEKNDAAENVSQESFDDDDFGNPTKGPRGTAGLAATADNFGTAANHLCKGFFGSQGPQSDSY